MTNNILSEIKSVIEHLLSELEAINGQIDLLLTAMDLMYSTAITKEEKGWTELDELF